MATQEEVLISVLGTVASILYFVVARIQAKREVSGEAQSALRGFIIWWAGLGGLGVVTVFLTLGPGLESMGLNGVRAVIYGLFAVIYVAFGGLVYYLAFLYTGLARTRWIVTVFYAAMFLFLVWLIEAHSPHVAPIHAGETNAGEVAFHLHDEPSAFASGFLGLGLVVPPLLAALAYALLFFRTHDATARYRIGMVSTGFVLWFLYSTVGTIARIITDSDQSFAGRITGQLLGVMAATLTLLAYEPPRWIRQRLRLRELGPAPNGPPEQRPRVATH